MCIIRSVWRPAVLANTRVTSLDFTIKYVLCKPLRDPREELSETQLPDDSEGENTLAQSATAQV